MNDKEDKAFERLEEVIMVLNTMLVGNGFCRTEISALEYAVASLEFIRDWYVQNVQIEERKNKYG